MAHNLMVVNGKAAMAYSGDTPWHGLGTGVQGEMTAREVLEKAKLDWGVTLHNVFASVNGEMREANGKRATVCDANGVVLGVVSNRYEPIQNVAAFEFFDSVVGGGQAIYHTAGALYQGERVWILAKLPGELVLPGNDVVTKYLLLVNSHDGSLALRMYYTPIRVVCHNTLTAALSNHDSGVKIFHRGNVKEKVESAREVLGLATKYYDRLEKIAGEMVNVALNVAEGEKYLETILPDKSMSEENLIEARHAVRSLAFSGKGQDGSGSAWGWWNGTTEYSDYHRKGTSGKVAIERRFASATIGSGSAFKAKAFDALMGITGLDAVLEKMNSN